MYVDAALNRTVSSLYERSTSWPIYVSPEKRAQFTCRNAMHKVSFVQERESVENIGVYTSLCLRWAPRRSQQCFYMLVQHQSSRRRRAEPSKRPRGCQHLLLGLVYAHKRCNFVQLSPRVRFRSGAAPGLHNYQINNSTTPQ